jgi:hypothetical protein
MSSDANDNKDFNWDQLGEEGKEYQELFIKAQIIDVYNDIYKPVPCENVLESIKKCRKSINAFKSKYPEVNIDEYIVKLRVMVQILYLRLKQQSSSVSDASDRVNEINEINGVNETHEVNEANESNESNETHEANEANEANNTDETGKVNNDS